MAEDRDIVVVIASVALGDQKEIGGKLMSSFLGALAESENKPRQIIFSNMGVFFTAERSDVLSTLQALADSGVEIRSCDESVKYFGLEDKLQVGETISMQEMVAGLTSGANVVRL